MSPRQSQRDASVERLFNAAIDAARGSLGQEGDPAPRRTVVVDPELDRHGRPLFLGDGEVRVSAGTYEALKRLFFVPGFRWTEADPDRARESGRALDALHDASISAALGESDVPRPDQPLETPEAYRLRTGVREGFARHTRADWLQRLGVTRAAPDVAQLPRSPAHPTAGRTAEALAFYLAERRGVAAGDVLRELTGARGSALAAVARLAIEAYDPELWARVQGLDGARREAVLRRVAAPLERLWRPDPDDRSTLPGVGAAVGLHHQVLEVADEAGLRRGAAEGASLDREKAEYRVHGAYIAWTKSSGAARARPLAERVAARAGLAAVLARERGQVAAQALGTATASVGRGVRRTARAVARPVARQVGRRQIAPRSRTGPHGAHQGAARDRGVRLLMRVVLPCVPHGHQCGHKGAQAAGERAAQAGRER